MSVVVIIMCCLIPCIGLALSALFLVKGNKRTKEEEEKGLMKADKLKLFGRMIGSVAIVWLVITLVLLNLVPIETKRGAVILCALLVTLQYGSAMVTIFMINKKL